MKKIIGLCIVALFLVSLVVYADKHSPPLPDKKPPTEDKLVEQLKKKPDETAKSMDKDPSLLTEGKVLNEFKSAASKNIGLLKSNANLKKKFGELHKIDLSQATIKSFDSATNSLKVETPDGKVLTIPIEAMKTKYPGAKITADGKLQVVNPKTKSISTITLKDNTELKVTESGLQAFGEGEVAFADAKTKNSDKASFKGDVTLTDNGVRFGAGSDFTFFEKGEKEPEKAFSGEKIEKAVNYERLQTSDQKCSTGSICGLGNFNYEVNLNEGNLKIHKMNEVGVREVSGEVTLDASQGTLNRLRSEGVKKGKLTVKLSKGTWVHEAGKMPDLMGSLSKNQEIISAFETDKGLALMKAFVLNDKTQVWYVPLYKLGKVYPKSTIDFNSIGPRDLVGLSFQKKFGDIVDLDSVKGRQQLLKNLGYDPGPIDGKWGSRSEEAFLRYRIGKEYDIKGYDPKNIEHVKQLQAKLIEKGYDLGDAGADGKIGRLTRTAIGKAFPKKEFSLSKDDQLKMHKLALIESVVKHIEADKAFKEVKELIDSGKIAEAQDRLKEAGLDPGKSDGKMGPKTSAAIASLESRVGEPRTVIAASRVRGFGGLRFSDKSAYFRSLISKRGGTRGYERALQWYDTIQGVINDVDTRGTTVTGHPNMVPNADALLALAAWESSVGYSRGTYTGSNKGPFQVNKVHFKRKGFQTITRSTSLDANTRMSVGILAEEHQRVLTQTAGTKLSPSDKIELTLAYYNMGAGKAGDYYYRKSGVKRAGALKRAIAAKGRSQVTINDIKKYLPRSTRTYMKALRPWFTSS